jgi:hypothetical protein
MLDRSQTANLFSENLPPAEGRDTAASESPDAAFPGRAPRRDRSPRARVPRRPVNPLHAGAWLARLTARVPRLRKAGRYAPVAVMVLLLLTHPAGFGRSVSTTAVTRRPSSTVSTVTVPVARTVTVHSAPPPPVVVRHVAAVTATAPHISRPRRVPAPSPPASYSPPPSPAAPGDTDVPVSPSSSPPPAVTTQRPPPAGGSQGDEFGFER